jgi:hypothetical protein
MIFDLGQIQIVSRPAKRHGYPTEQEDLDMAEAARKVPPVMHDTDREDYLAQAERHIAFVQNRIARQKRIIEDRIRAGEETDCASRCFMLSRRACTRLSSIARRSSSGARTDGPSVRVGYSYVLQD